MNWKESYNDTVNELRILQIREMEIRRRVEMAHKVIFSGEIPSSGSYVHIPLDKGIDWYNKAVGELEEIQAEVDRVNGIKLEMERYMNRFTGLANVIQCKRMEGKTYKEIAIEMGYSESHIRNHMSKKYKHSTEKDIAS
ncbi:hypothetical protein AMQ84_27180 [Paenibacillus riograndensis]|uniref:RNA polymerase sigma-70 region 4 domain-containing protein n=1 Tax=Paenibacillus riograndensis TaxID=483937 RepID=A0A132TJU8_9BACL|nr:hypothetical protein [Paenibacillus riograndensis]KWX71608.1 hypothetical protein AMQ84_27180 [Paenibacillus riograndensis]